MKTLRNQLILFVTICLTGIIAWKSYATTEPAQTSLKKWEYRGLLYAAVPNQEAAEMRKVNELGNEGWELVGFTAETQTGRNGANVVTRPVHIFYFKRPK